MPTIYISHEDDNRDGITDYVAVYSDDFGGEPLIGDYRGVELCRVNYIPSRAESVLRAEEIARAVVAAESERGACFSERHGNPYQNPYAYGRLAANAGDY